MGNVFKISTGIQCTDLVWLNAQFLQVSPFTQQPDICPIAGQPIVVKRANRDLFMLKSESRDGSFDLLVRRSQQNRNPDPSFENTVGAGVSVPTRQFSSNAISNSPTTFYLNASDDDHSKYHNACLLFGAAVVSNNEPERRAQAENMIEALEEIVWDAIIHERVDDAIQARFTEAWTMLIPILPERSEGRARLLRLQAAIHIAREDNAMPEMVIAIFIEALEACPRDSVVYPSLVIELAASYLDADQFALAESVLERLEGTLETAVEFESRLLWARIYLAYAKAEEDRFLRDIYYGTALGQLNQAQALLVNLVGTEEQGGSQRELLMKLSVLQSLVPQGTGAIESE